MCCYDGSLSVCYVVGLSHKHIVHKTMTKNEYQKLYKKISVQSQTRLFTIQPALSFTCSSNRFKSYSKLHILRNPMMYTSPMFELKEAAKSQVERLPN